MVGQGAVGICCPTCLLNTRKTREVLLLGFAVVFSKLQFFLWDVSESR